MEGVKWASVQDGSEPEGGGSNLQLCQVQTISLQQPGTASPSSWLRGSIPNACAEYSTGMPTFLFQQKLGQKS